MQQTASIKPSFTLAKNERLKSRKLLEQLFRAGSSFFVHPFKVYYKILPVEQAQVLQAGFGVSSRAFKKAVDRNRIKRLTREAYRLQKNPFQEALAASENRLAVFFLYTGKELPEAELINEKIRVVLQQLENRLSNR